MLAMTFVSILLLSIAMTIIQIGNIYSKGMALKDINQSGRLIADDIKRTVAEAGEVSLSDDRYVLRPTTGATVSGRLCLGNYTYLWNTADAPGSADAIMIDSEPLEGLVKVPDSAMVYCAKNATGGLVTGNAVRPDDIPKLANLLVDGDHSLSVTDFSVNASSGARDTATGQGLFMVDYSLGTGEVSAMNAARTACLPQGDSNADPTYCNVQQFNLIVRSGGGR